MPSGVLPGWDEDHAGSVTKAIETIKVGDSISTVSKEWRSGTGKVTSVFVTKNRLFEVQMDQTKLVITETQPLCLASGELRAAGELRKGDIIIKLVAGIRVQVNVTNVVKTDRYESVYNLVLGEPTMFIANGYLARSKPPAVVVSR